MKVLVWLACACAVLAGGLLIAVALMTVVSVTGRAFFGKTFVGDIELTAVIVGAAIALFVPWCQLKRANIIVDFFTAKASVNLRDALDRCGALVLAVMCGVFAWRTTLGGISVYKSHSGTMILGFPEWIVYAVIAPAMLLATAIACVQAMCGVNAFGEQGDLAPEVIQ